MSTRRLQHPGAHVHGRKLLAQLGAGLGEAGRGAGIAQAVAPLGHLALPLVHLL